MKGLSGSVGDGRFLIAATARKMSLVLISYDGDVFFPMAGSESAHIFFRPTPYGFRQVVQHVSKHVAFGIN